MEGHDSRAHVDKNDLNVHAGEQRTMIGTRLHAESLEAVASKVVSRCSRSNQRSCPADVRRARRVPVGGAEAELLHQKLSQRIDVAVRISPRRHLVFTQLERERHAHIHCVIGTVFDFWDTEQAFADSQTQEHCATAVADSCKS